MWMSVWLNFQLGFLSLGGLHCWLIIHLPRAENQFANALATLAFMIEIPAGVTV